MKADVSIVVPTCQYGHFIEEALDSVFAQTVEPLEVLVFDDGSTDGTADLVRERYGGRARVASGPHRGVYSVRQEALGRISGSWFLNLDADNRIPPDFLETLLAAVRKGPESLAFVYPDRIHFGRRRYRVQVPEYDPRCFLRGNFVDMNALVRTDAARSVGFDASFNEGWGDYDFFLSLAEAGYTGRAEHGTALEYRIHDASLTARAGHDLGRNQRLMREIIQKHQAFFSDEEARMALARYTPRAARRNIVGGLLRDGRIRKAVQTWFALGKEIRHHE